MQDKWAPLPLLPVRYFGLGQVNGKLVAVGGVKAKDKTPSNEIYTYDEKVQRWKQTIPPMQMARSTPGVLSLQSVLVVAGGELEQNSYSNTVEIFKPGMSQWQETDPLPTACCKISTVSIGNTCYVLGGYKYPSNLKQVLCASVDDLLCNASSANVHTTHSMGSDRKDVPSAWKTLPDIPIYIPTAGVLAGNLIAIGGDKTISEGGAKTKAYVYSHSTDSWIFISDLPTQRSMTTVANLSSTEILVIGGKYSGNNVKTVYKGTLSMRV